jgi:(p)ppGpp synthase/HD superfamily hydrolase
VKSKIRGTKMTRNTTNLSILTLNLNGVNTPIKRHKIKNYFKNKAQSFVVSKKHNSLEKTNTGLE